MVVGNIRIIRVYCVYQVEKTNRQQKGQGVELFSDFCDGHTRLSCVYSKQESCKYVKINILQVWDNFCRNLLLNNLKVLTAFLLGVGNPYSFLFLNKMKCNSL